MATFLKKTGKMLRYAKKILVKVSFDATLFKKELQKAIRLLVADEVKKLKKWCYRKFGGQYDQVLEECFVLPSQQSFLQQNPRTHQ
jgi:hypothetical protein